jgi:guanylate kinase
MEPQTNDKENRKRLQQERRRYLLTLMTSVTGGVTDIEKYDFSQVFIFFGFTGSGKDAVIDGFLKQNTKYPFSKFVRTLTRPKRPSEDEILSGYFVEKELFDHLRERGRFFYHYEKYDGDEFGYDAVHLIFTLARGNVIMVGGNEKNLKDLVTGIKSVFDNIPITTVFINRPKEDIIEGIKKRGGDPEQIKKRIEAIEQGWYKDSLNCDHSIWNTDIDSSVKDFQDLVELTLRKKEGP